MPVCSCKQHAIFLKDEPLRIYRISSKKFKTSVVGALVENGHLCKRSVFLCTACAAYSEKNFISNEKDIEDKLVEQVINLIKTNNISDENVIKIAEAIDSRDDFNDNVFSQYKNVDFLTCATETNSCLRSWCLCVENRCPTCHHQRKLRLFLLLKICTLISSNIIMQFFI